MSFIEEIKNRAKKEIKTIVLPEANDIRTLKAAEAVSKEKYAKIILIGNKEEVLNLSKENSINLGEIQIIDPKESQDSIEYASKLYELRKEKGMTEEKAKALVLDPVYFGMMMLKLRKSRRACFRSLPFNSRHPRTRTSNSKNRSSEQNLYQHFS